MDGSIIKPISPRLRHSHVTCVLVTSTVLHSLCKLMVPESGMYFAHTTFCPQYHCETWTALDTSTGIVTLTGLNTWSICVTPSDGLSIMAVNTSEITLDKMVEMTWFFESTMSMGVAVCTSSAPALMLKEAGPME